MQPDPTAILEALWITQPLIGLCDAPDPAPFAPLVVPADEEERVFALVVTPTVVPALVRRPDRGAEARPRTGPTTTTG